MPEKKSSSKVTTKKKDNRGGRRPGTGNPALTGKAFDQEEGRNRKYILSAMSLWELPAIDLKDEEQIKERTDTYFAMMAEQDMKPTVVGYAMALGLDRDNCGLWSTINPIRVGDTCMTYRRDVLTESKKATKLWSFCGSPICRTARSTP